MAVIFRDPTSSPYTLMSVPKGTAVWNFNNSNATYLVNKQIGAINPFFQPQSVGVGTGVVLEQLTFVDASHTEPELDIFVFNQPLTGTYADNAYPSLSAADAAALAGVIQLRAANWRGIYNGLGTKQYSVGTINPYLSLNIARGSTDTFTLVVTPATASWVPTAINQLTMAVTIRQ